MGFSLYNIFKAGILLTNAVLILNPQRFLVKFNLHQIDQSESITSPKNQLVNFLSAVQYLKGPIIIINILIILLELLLGG